MAQVTGGAASKVGKIKQVRKNIARILTVINTKARDAYKKEVKGYKNNKVPKTLRQKKTRAIRRALTPKEVRTCRAWCFASWRRSTFSRALPSPLRLPFFYGVAATYWLARAHISPCTLPPCSPPPTPTARRGDLEAEEEAQLCTEEVCRQSIKKDGTHRAPSPPSLPWMPLFLSCVLLGIARCACV